MFQGSFPHPRQARAAEREQHTEETVELRLRALRSKEAIQAVSFILTHSN